MPLFNDFKNEYVKLISNNDKDSNKININKNLKNIEAKINEEEAKLDKINKKIFNKESGFFSFKNNIDPKQLKIDSVKQAKTLYNLYKEFDQCYFKDKVLSILSSSLTISELLHLYYSFDYFKKVAIKRVYDLTSYDDVIKYSDSFDLFAMNPTNIIINGVALFEESDIAKVIMNKYRLDNINLTEENINPDDTNTLMDKIQLLLRIKEIEQSSTSIEKIWFMVQVEKINMRESKQN
jgi:hypothetical protein